MTFGRQIRLDTTQLHVFVVGCLEVIDSRRLLFQVFVWLNYTLFAPAAAVAESGIMFVFLFTVPK